MARLSKEEKRELLSKGPSVAAEMAMIKKEVGALFYNSDGTLNYVAITSFLNQMNLILGHPRKSFRPIKGDRFLL